MLSTHGFIDVLEVHKDFRRRGIGRKLVREAERVSEEHGCRIIAVWPNPEAVGFYRRCGISDVAFRVKHVRLNLSSIVGLNPGVLKLKEFPESYDSLKNWMFVSPRIESSFVAWVKSRWDYAVEEEVVKYFEALLPELGAALILESLWLNQDEASLYLWVKDLDSLPQAIEVGVKMAKYMGFNALRLLVSEEIYRRYVMRYRHELLNDYLVLFKRLE